MIQTHAPLSWITRWESFWEIDNLKKKKKRSWHTLGQVKEKKRKKEVPEEENGMVVGDWVEKKGRQQAKRNLLCQAPMWMDVPEKPLKNTLAEQWEHNPF